MVESAAQRILIVGGSDDERIWVRNALMTDLEMQWTLEHAVEPTAAMAHAGRGDLDAIALFLDGGDDEIGLAPLRQIREFAPHLPIVCLARDGAEAEALKVIYAGAQDCFGANERDAERFRRAVRFAIARGSFQQGQDELREYDVREREIGGLNAIGGPVPMPVTGRIFGMLPLIDRAPEQFSEFVSQYSGLLELALEERTVRVESRLGEELNTLADQLGLLGAGPRDIIDLHKAAITGRLEGQSIRKARAYVEEGRLMLLQIMGFLASFYRHLSWGAAADPRGRTTRDDPFGAGPPTRGRGSA